AAVVDGAFRAHHQAGSEISDGRHPVPDSGNVTPGINGAAPLRPGYERVAVGAHRQMWLVHVAGKGAVQGLRGAPGVARLVVKAVEKVGAQRPDRHPVAVLVELDLRLLRADARRARDERRSSPYPRRGAREGTRVEVLC